jgi:hypothetical protein
MKCFPVWVFVLVSLAALACIITGLYIVDCHVSHSCPAVNSEYECGDLGYCQQCPDNKFCKNQRPFNYQSPDVYVLGKGFDFVTGSSVNFLLELRGDLKDKEGNPLFSVRPGYFWWIDQKQKVQISELYNHVVAISPSGKVVGEGVGEGLYYSLKFNQGWDQENDVEIKVGYYVPWDAKSTRLYPCTKINIQDFVNDPVVLSQYYAVKDLVCDRIAVLIPSYGYRN